MKMIILYPAAHYYP